MSEAWAAIIAALVGAIAATLGLVITKESKISEFRQIWISELRGLLTSYSSKMSVMNSLGDGPEEKYEEKIEAIGRLTSEIKLRLNYSNPSIDEKELLEKMFLLAGKVSNSLEIFLPLVKEFDVAAFKVLKGEWNRVKRGEIKYRLCLYGCLFAISLSSIIIFIYIYFHIDSLINVLTN
ncbi:hypothetical protein [Pantoea ananatis]|uniref:hypothetical protein n=2 Tax=Pantoea ananas TaxID=553 RepID=UPI001B303BA3|nr:hypothetical protein [Pantoea ananatis]